MLTDLVAQLPEVPQCIIGNVCCSAYPIEQLDTINASTGELNMQSALNLIVFGVRRVQN